MHWKRGLNGRGEWIGPMRVIVQENQNTIWATMLSRMFRISPEQTRPVTSAESHQIQPLTQDPQLTPIESQLTGVRGQGVTRFEESIGSPRQQILQFPEHSTESPQRPSSNREPRLPSRQVTIEQPDDEPGSDNLPSDGTSRTSNVPENIPVPEESDSELLTTGFVCTDLDGPDPLLPDRERPLASRQEFQVTEADVERWRQSPDPTDMSFLASTSKKQRTEVRLSELSPEELKQFDRAKDTEVQNWLKTNTVRRILRNAVPESHIIRCRWILVWKPLDPTDVKPGEKPFKAKARLVVLGFLDPQLTEIPRDSPTLGRIPKQLQLQLCASMGWTLKSFDIKAAFLQGELQSQDRKLAIEPVEELRRAMQLKPNEICELTKSAYGLVDAPFMWYQILVKAIKELKFLQSPFDPCQFVLRHPCGKLAGILGIHVDDGLASGDSYFDTQVAALEQRFPFGAKKSTEFTFTGVDLKQHPDKGITLSQSAYVRKIAPIAMSQQRRSEINAPVTEPERQALRALVGSLQYDSVHTRPDLAGRLSFLQSAINRATVQTLIDGNRALYEAKAHHDLVVHIKPIAPQDLRFLAFSDASFASAKVPDSHSGMFIVATHKDILCNHSTPISPISWGSKKIQRVVTSTLAAETASLQMTLDQLSWIRLCWSWMLDSNTAWKDPAKTLQKLPEGITTVALPDVAATDCKSLFDLVSRTAPPNCQEFRTQLNDKAIKEHLAEGCVLKWVHSGAQLADSLTKVMPSDFLREALRTGVYKLHDATAILKERASHRNRLRWLREQDASSSSEANKV